MTNGFNEHYLFAYGHYVAGHLHINPTFLLSENRNLDRESRPS